MSDLTNYLENMKNMPHRKERNSLSKLETIANENDDDDDSDSDSEPNSNITNPLLPVFKLLPNSNLQNKEDENYNETEEDSHNSDENTSLSESNDEVIEINKETFEKNEETSALNTSQNKTNNTSLQNKSESKVEKDSSFSPAKLNFKSTRQSMDLYNLNLSLRTSPSRQYNRTSSSILKSSILSNKKLNFIKSIMIKNTNYGFFIILFTILFAIFSMNFSKSDKNNYKNTIKEQSRNLNFHLEQLKQKYPNQTRQFWANIESSFKHSIIESKDPSIILIVNDVETKILSQKLIIDILESLIKALNFGSNIKNLIIDPVNDRYLSKLIRNLENDRSKLHLDEKLNLIFKSGERLALVNNIELLPAHSMLLFYTYGDDFTNAKYPGILILMSLSIQDKIEDKKRYELLKSSSKLTEFAEDYMFNLWSKYIADDQLKPLFTRIANNVIFVNNE